MKGKKKMNRKRQDVPVAMPSSYRENPSVRIEKVDNGLIVHGNNGRSKVATSETEAYAHAKKLLKIG